MHISFKILVAVDGQDVYSKELGSSALEAIACSIDSDRDDQVLIGYLSQSPSYEVRKQIARIENISPITLERLADDECAAVRRELLSNSAFQKWSPTSFIAQNVLDPEYASELASCINNFQNADESELAVLLASHGDPSVRKNLARNWCAPKKLINRLLNDPDPSVSSEAQRTLQR